MQRLFFRKKPPNTVSPPARKAIWAKLALVLAAALALGALGLAPDRRQVGMTTVREGLLILPMSGQAVLADGDETSRIYFSHDKKRAALIAKRRFGETDRLYHVGKTVTLINPDIVDWHIPDLKISDDGNTLLYLAQLHQPAERQQVLRLYRKGKTQIIAQGNIERFCLSPDGKTVAFCARTDQNAPWQTALWQDGQITPLGEDLWPLAVSDGGRYFYYTERERGGTAGLYVQTGDERQRLGDSAMRGPYFSGDRSQIVFSSNGQTYISLNGNRRQSLPGDISMLWGADWNNNAIARKNFVNSIYHVWEENGDKSVYQINEDYQSVYLGKADRGTISQQDEILFYNNCGQLFPANAPANGTSALSEVKEVAAVRVSEDGRAMALVSADGRLFFQNRTGKAVEISGGLELGITGSTRRLFAMDEAKNLYYVANGGLYVSKGGKKGRLLPTPGEKAHSVMNIGTVLVVGVMEGRWRFLYYSTDGKAFFPLAEVPRLPEE